MATLKVADAECTRLHIAIDNHEERGVQFQVERNVGEEWVGRKRKTDTACVWVASCVYTFTIDTTYPVRPLHLIHSTTQIMCIPSVHSNLVRYK